MCGFCGFIVRDRPTGVDWTSVLNTMTNVLVHRGPDSNGHYSTNSGDSIVGFGIGDAEMWRNQVFAEDRSVN